MTTSRRLAPLPLLLIGLAVLAALLLVPWVVHAQTPVNQDATGRPVVLASAGRRRHPVRRHGGHRRRERAPYYRYRQ